MDRASCGCRIPADAGDAAVARRTSVPELPTSELPLVRPMLMLNDVWEAALTWLPQRFAVACNRRTSRCISRSEDCTSSMHEGRLSGSCSVEAKHVRPTASSLVVLSLHVQTDSCCRAERAVGGT